MARINPKPFPIISPQIASRFWARVTKGSPDQCWPWQGMPDKDGYGFFGIGERGNYRTHRVAYFLTTETDPLDLLVCHTCDNPPCCNPAHLFVASHNENTQDKIRKGRDARGDRSGRRLHPERYAHLKGKPKRPESVSRGSRHGCAKLTEHQVLQIRDAYSKGGATQKQIGARFGVTNYTVSLITKRKIWKHI